MRDGGFIYVGGGQTSGYLWLGGFYCNVVATGEDEEQQSAVEDFLRVLGEKASCRAKEEEAREYLASECSASGLPMFPHSAPAGVSMGFEEPVCPGAAFAA